MPKVEWTTCAGCVHFDDRKLPSPEERESARAEARQKSEQPPAWRGACRRYPPNGRIWSEVSPDERACGEYRLDEIRATP